MVLEEMRIIGFDSSGLIAVIAVFMGAVFTVQAAYQLVSGLIADSVIGSIVGDSALLELSPTISNLILAGKVASKVSTEIGSMRASEQIDALDVMGVNSASYLILPKIIATVVVVPCLMVLSMTVTMISGATVGHITGLVSVGDFVLGVRSTFDNHTLLFAFSKAFTFAFIMSSVPSYYGYYTKGGALDVGRSSTRAVVATCLWMLVMDYALAELML